jgi:hypothetical protein
LQKRQLTKAQSSKRLLKTLTDNPALPAFVRTLQAPVLKRLIDHVGLRDAGDLIALTTPEQMRDILEESLWESLTPGRADRLRPERFLEWLDVMFEAGSAFATQRLIELGDTFVVINFAPLISVTDRSVAAEHVEERCICVLCELDRNNVPYEVIGEYIVAGTHEDEWEIVKTALVELEGEDSEFLHRVLARCSSAPTMRDFDPTANPLLDDETHEREQRREQAGFVTPQMAAVFLKSARTASRDDLVAQASYDTLTQRYFDQLAAATAAAAAAAAAERQQALEEADEQPDEVPITPVQLRALQSALADAEITGDRDPQLLTGPKDAREPTLELQARLDRLQLADPKRFAARLGELIFLANVLMSGSWYQGARFSEAAAAKAALACANLGLLHVLEVETRGRPTSASDRTALIEQTLESPPGMVRLFQIGWHLIQALPMHAARTLLDVLRSEHVRDQLKRKRWILDEIESAVSEPDLLDLIEDGDFEDVSDNLVLLGLVLDGRACQCLRTVISDFPRYPLQLNLGFRPGSPPTNESQYLTTPDQLQTVNGFLSELDALLKI